MRSDGQPHDATIWIADDLPRDSVEQLFLHMIATGLYDLVRERQLSGAGAKYRKCALKRQQRSALAWFSESNGAKGVTFRMACDGLGYDFDRFQRNVLNMSERQLRILVDKIKVLQTRQTRKGL